MTNKCVQMICFILFSNTIIYFYIHTKQKVLIEKNKYTRINKQVIKVEFGHF